ncbi:nuclear factor of activated T-cells 5 isoform X2 [Cylas formicarius]|uniref:nuclear factor of activated T-cells 5 isoform X2 n=1 Tax=Cylas formicarius TaxID=197179 RepID=UPI0029587971|nr:nuclear factor of activated T-cells 5 isoform X2 [Cylas formicarius]
MTLSTKPLGSSARSQRRVGRPSGGKRVLPREVSGKIRSEYRRSLDSSENSNDSGLGHDHQTDPHHHTMPMIERLGWSDDRLESKRLRMDIKVENEDPNSAYCFSANAREPKENLSLIRTVPSSVSVSSLSISSNANTTSTRTASRCMTTSGRQSLTSPLSLTAQLSSTSHTSDIALTIVKQPEQQHRARYQTEGSRGAVKDREGNGFPIVQLTGYYKPATLQVYIGTDVGKVTPHMFYQACKVSGKNSTPCTEKKIEGTCVIELAFEPSKEMCATCDCVGILKERNVDVEHRFPDQLGNRSKKKSTRCRMIFRTTITHDNGTQETLQVCSQPIICTQPPGIPEICKKSLTSCPASGGLELFVLGKNFLKDTKVYFQQYEESRVCWESAVAPDKEYLQQTHFVCVVPPYRRSNITEPVMVRLCVVSSGKTSESHQFVYTPVNGAVPSVHLDAQHAQPAHFFKSALWSAPLQKREDDLEIMPPPESNLVPMSTRRSSVSLPSSSDVQSPPIQTMKQEYIDENSQSSMTETIEVHRERYRPVSESSLDVNHDSNMSLINDNSIDMIHHGSVISDNSNQSVSMEDTVDVVHHQSAEAAKTTLPETPPAVMSATEKVMDLRMKLPLSDEGDYATTTSMATLKKLGIEPTNAPLPTQSAQSVENYLTKIESKSTVTADGDKMKLLTPLLASSASQFGYLSGAVKTDTAAFSGDMLPSKTAEVSLTSALEPIIINQKLDEIVNTTLESHIGAAADTNFLQNKETIITPQDVMLTTQSQMMVSPVINARMPSPVMEVPSNHAHAITPEIILPAAMICQSATTVQPESLLPAVCQATPPVGDSSLITSSSRPLMSQVAHMHAPILATDPEKAVLLEAAVDFLKTQKKISEMNTSVNDITVSSSTSINPILATQIHGSMDRNFVQHFGGPAAMKSIESKSDFVPLPVNDLASPSTATDKKTDDRMIPQSFTALTENELINFINPSCFDQV